MVKCINFVQFLVFMVFIYGYFCQDFGYDGDEGPSEWGKRYKQCVGKHQSPIDIDIHNVQMVNLPKLRFDFFNKPLRNVRLTNTGHTVKMTIEEGPTPTINGGPLNGTYEFNHLHFHWGNNDTHGSENMLNHNSFPLELHVLFYNKYYGSLDEASKHTDGYLVLSFLYSTSTRSNKHYDLFESGLSKIVKINSTYKLNNFESLDKFTTARKDSYFTYEGSLTTPPCSEIVTWIEFRDTIPITHEQIEHFRQLNGPHGKLTHNYRPTQNLNDRIIRMNSSATLKTSSLLLGWLTICLPFLLNLIR
ncbi:unnamed protein product [Brassicogethes aeneus]|uniref:Carbonic anhydrase n=1 Tax=Brassicogethes aeneus TaxID=1431903 RepID=A0A9P0B2F3_BRAAE|nr:unnamed protein product [Brassicogethes aeneus]